MLEMLKDIKEEIVKGIKERDALIILSTILLVIAVVFFVMVVIMVVKGGAPTSTGHQGTSHVIIINGKPMVLYY